MKLTRRNALMASIGAMFGGKDATKSILQNGGSILGHAGANLKTEDYKVGLEGSSISGSAYPFDKIENYNNQISRLTKFLNGGLEDWQEDQLKDYSDYRRGAELHRIDGLKSIAPHYKLSMVDRLHKQRLREAWIKEAKRELKCVLSYKDNFLKMLDSKNKIDIRDTVGANSIMKGDSKG